MVQVPLPVPRHHSQQIIQRHGVKLHIFWDTGKLLVITFFGNLMQLNGKYHTHLYKKQEIKLGRLTEIKLGRLTEIWYRSHYQCLGTTHSKSYKDMELSSHIFWDIGNLLVITFFGNLMVNITHTFIKNKK